MSDNKGHACLAWREIMSIEVCRVANCTLARQFLALGSQWRFTALIQHHKHFKALLSDVDLIIIVGHIYKTDTINLSNVCVPFAVVRRN